MDTSCAHSIWAVCTVKDSMTVTGEVGEASSCSDDIVPQQVNLLEVWMATTGLATASDSSMLMRALAVSRPTVAALGKCETVGDLAPGETEDYCLPSTDMFEVREQYFQVPYRTSACD